MKDGAKAKSPTPVEDDGGRFGIRWPCAVCVWAWTSGSLPGLLLRLPCYDGHLQTRRFRRQPAQVGFFSSHFFLLPLQVKQPVRVLTILVLFCGSLTCSLTCVDMA